MQGNTDPKQGPPIENRLQEGPERHGWAESENMQSLGTINPNMRPLTLDTPKIVQREVKVLKVYPQVIYVPSFQGLQVFTDYRLAT